MFIPIYAVTYKYIITLKEKCVESVKLYKTALTIVMTNCFYLFSLSTPTSPTNSLHFSLPTCPN